MQACPECSVQFDPLKGGYNASGQVVCAECAAKVKAAQSAQKAQAKGSAFIGSVGALLIALASFAVEHRLVFFLFPLAAIGAGGGTALTALKNPESIQALGWKRWPTVVLGILAILFASLSLVAYFL